jgi:hypothetical protein
LGYVNLLLTHSGFLKTEMSLLFPVILGPQDEASLRIINQVIISILPMTIMVWRQAKIHQRQFHKSPGRLTIKELVVRICLCSITSGLCNDGQGPPEERIVKMKRRKTPTS